MLKKLWNDEAGTIVSLELLLIVSLLTIVCGRAWAKMGTQIAAKVAEITTYVSKLNVVLT
jgi:hypothetical protein